jgi:hypothetical protein
LTQPNVRPATSAVATPCLPAPPGAGRVRLAAALAGLLAMALPAAAQDLNIPLTVDCIETLLRQEPLRVLDMAQARPAIADDRSAWVRLAGSGCAEEIPVKWKPVGRNARGFNNEPRYELAAYELQKLFLDEPEYVVPPIALRSMPLDEYRELRAAPQPTLHGTSSVLFLLAFWVDHVTSRSPFDADRFAQDSIYARLWGNANILTYIIEHSDENIGNLLISTVAWSPRVFAVDNDIAFRSRESEQGDRWRWLQLPRLPHHTVERLRRITLADLEARLAVVAEFAIIDGALVPAAPGPNLRPAAGVRQARGRVQFGLTRAEIRRVHARITTLLRDVDSGRITTF